MIIATPINLPRIEPDSWDIFWDIWNKHSKDMVKCRMTYANSKSPIGSHGIWKGLDIFRNYDRDTDWEAPFFDIQEYLPKLYGSIVNLPFDNIYRVRLVESLRSISAHSDVGIDKWEVRALFHYTDTQTQWYFTRPDQKEKHWFNLPNETNWFGYNDKNCLHGSIYNPDHPKILLQLFSDAPSNNLIEGSIHLYRKYAIDL